MKKLLVLAIGLGILWCMAPSPAMAGVAKMPAGWRQNMRERVVHPPPTPQFPVDTGSDTGGSSLVPPVKFPDTGASQTTGSQPKGSVIYEDQSVTDRKEIGAGSRSKRGAGAQVPKIVWILLAVAVLGGAALLVLGGRKLKRGDVVIISR
ncbi:MAG: hypothetical protein HYU64_03650 [Armatimonadetes bacterium]|nr:hypothetical protein [Armatimonadota bacterium]